MARKGLLKNFRPSNDPEAARFQDNAKDAVETLTADDDLIQAPAVSLVTAGSIPAKATVVIYRGGPSQTLSLPAAAARGQNTAYVVHVLNAASVAVTLARTGADTLNGGASLSLAAGKLAVLVSDGMNLWKAVTS